MLFNSFTFILIFMPAVLAGTMIVARFGRPQWVLYFLSICSLAFYAWWDWSLSWILAVSVVANYLFALGLDRWRTRTLLGLGIAANLGILGYFKYIGFFTETVNAMFGTGFAIDKVILPLAISFFTFQQIAFLVDVYRKISKERNFAKYCLFVTFFPQLVAGPIVHHSEVMPQYDEAGRTSRFGENFAIGITIFSIGLIKKVIVADTFAVYSDLVFDSAAAGDVVTFIPAWAGAAAFSLEIYFDFSGYTDMAIGLSRMFNIRLPLNFNSPYKAASIIDFWRAWHMTLSRFLRDYLYFPLGGARRGGVRRYVNLLIVMVLGGLWHGAAWTFVFWGGLHGFYLIVNHLWRRLFGDLLDRFILSRVVSHGMTLGGVIYAWVFFRAESWNAAWIMSNGMLGANGIFLPASYEPMLGVLLGWAGVEFGVGPDPTVFPTLTTLQMIVAMLGFCLIAPNTQQVMSNYGPTLDGLADRPANPLRRIVWQPGIASAVIVSGVFVVSVIFMLKTKPHAFIYFQF